MNILMVGLGGFLGSVARYFISGLAAKQSIVSFPYGTLIVNVLGCAFAGLVMFLSEDQLSLSPSFRLFIGVGFLGGFTTFSAFGYETISLLRNQQLFYAGGYILANVILGIGSVGAVYLLLKQLR